MHLFGCPHYSVYGDNNKIEIETICNTTKINKYNLFITKIEETHLSMHFIIVLTNGRIAYNNALLRYSHTVGWYLQMY